MPAPTAALLTALILERPMCIDCIARRTRLSVDAADGVLRTIARAVVIDRADGVRCRECGRTGVAFSVARPAAAVRDLRAD